jgi:hypothetical protein
MGSTFALASLVVFLLPILSAALAVVSIPGDAPGRIAMAIPGFVLGAFLARLLVRRIPMQGKENDDDCAR